MSATGNDIGETGRTGAGATQDPRTLERRSDQIRADMNQTLDQLQRQYSPGALLDRGMELFRENGGELQQNLGRSIRENPMPALLTLVGVGWMILATQQRSRGAGYQAYGDVDEDLDYRGGYTGRDASEYSGTDTSEMGLGVASGPLPDDGDAASGVKEKLGAKASAAGERIRGAKDSVARSMHAGRERIAERGSALAGTARMQSDRAQEGFHRMIEEQPLVVGAIGVAIGALIGALIPESEKERQVMGQARENAMDKARELGEQGYAAARETASKAAAAVKDATAEDREALKAKAGGTATTGSGAGSRGPGGVGGTGTGGGMGGSSGAGGMGSGTSSGGAGGRDPWKVQ